MAQHCFDAFFRIRYYMKKPRRCMKSRITNHKSQITQPQHNSPFSLHLHHFHWSDPLPIPPTAPMRIVYNQSGFNTSRHIERYQSGLVGNRTRYTNAEKVGMVVSWSYRTFLLVVLLVVLLLGASHSNLLTSKRNIADSHIVGIVIERGKRL